MFGGLRKTDPDRFFASRSRFRGGGGDLAADILDSISSLETGEGAAAAGNDSLDLDEIFSDFNEKDAAEPGAEDAETHFNLGIAYKEMGLLDDAVGEFDKSMRSPVRMLDSLILKGACLVEKGDFVEAESAFRSGLACQGLGSVERASIHYEIGLLYESWERPLEALDSFQAVADIDLFFRGVGEKIAELRNKLGLDEKDDDEDTGPKGNKSRVSYV